MDTKCARVVSLLIGFTALLVQGQEKSWKPASGRLQTKWAKEVSPAKAHPEYPRPQLTRKEWLNLNGLWDFAIAAKDSEQPAQYNRSILVPFAPESALSGIMTNVTENDRLWYRRTFSLPPKWRGRRVILHFGAADFETTVWVNKQEAGRHRGGYDPFHFDITASLQPGENELVVSCWDPTDAGPYARGKQVRKPDQGIFYTAASGIWQTVWLEPVDSTHITSVKLVPDIDRGVLRAVIQATNFGANHHIELVAKDGNAVHARAGGRPGQEIQLQIPRQKLWSPERPFLYGLQISLDEGERTLDRVESYFGMRKVDLQSDEKGIKRLFLNNKPCFMIGPLDQGFWPDGIYTAPTDAALRYDIEITKQMGFNMARKHVKVEPARWYYWCDRLGLMVWQDMPSGDKFIGPRDPDTVRTPESAGQFERELRALIDSRHNHPSIVMWVVFNEGWGQYDTARLAKWTKDYDPARLVNSASGWTDRGVGDVHDMHRYPGPGPSSASPAPPRETLRASVLGEFGGLGFKVDGHTWAGNTWGYRGMDSLDKLTRQYVKLWRGVYALKENPGLSAAVYTQTTDVEYEGNGLLTYDRAVIKIPLKTLRPIHRGDFPPGPRVTTVVPTAPEAQATWTYTTNAPGADWFSPAFNPANWKSGPGGFGTPGTPGGVIRTSWNTRDIWLRREFNLPAKPSGTLRLMLHHDEDAVVYINGVPAASVRGFITDYDDLEIAPAALATLKPGPNLLAIHCRQTGGGQYIDAGISAFEPAGPANRKK